MTRCLIALVAAVQMASMVLPASANVTGHLHPTQDYEQIPEQAHLIYDAVRIPTADGLELQGWFFPSQSDTGEERRDPAPIVIMVPLNQGNMGNLLWHYYRLFAGLGWHVLTFDWRGFGQSAGWELPEDVVVVPEFIRDLSAALDYAQTRPEWDGDHLGLLAFNMGAAVSLATLADRSDVTCAALRGVYANQADYVGALNQSDALAEGAPPLTVNEEFSSALDPMSVAAQVTTPIFLISGAEDTLAPPAVAKALYGRLGGRSQYWEVPEAGHTGDALPELVQLQEFTARIQAFFRRYMGEGGR